MMASDQLLSHKARLETSYAFSRTFNPRNLEVLWYPLWCQTLFDLVTDVPNLIVAPQFPVWITRQHDDELEDADDGDDPEEIKDIVKGEKAAAAKIQVPRAGNEPEEGDHYEVGAGDISFASTVPEKEAVGVLVDFAILSLGAVPQPKEKLRYGGWRITGANVCLFVELKRFASRSLKDDELNAEIYTRVQEARFDLVNQAGYLFIKDETKNSVMVIAAAGPFWSGATIHRDDIKLTMHLLSTDDPSYQPSGEEFADEVLKWNKIIRLDGASSALASEARLRTVCKKMREMRD
ncbi:hypothetical protein F4604DRAFT_1962097 [Suillus subluteus]|nr:hypothetical protein F4604DRAFT_1962097 [Suillus subluteus]